MKPEISVIIPVYNGEKYLAETITSVLEQNHPKLEILVLDNASTDGSAEIARSFPSVKHIFLPEKGLVKALNHGVEQCESEYLAFCDADDLWKPGKLAAQLDVFKQQPQTDMVFGHVEQFISPELEEPVKSKLQIREKELPGYYRGTLLVKKDSFWKAGKFDTTTDYGDFIDWYMRAQEQGLKEVLLSDVLVLRRVHGANMGCSDPSGRVDFVRVLKRGLDRRRRLGKI